MAGVIRGINKVLENLTKETDAIKSGSAKGVLKGALLVIGKSQTLTPIRLGNLRNSRFVISSSLPSPEQGGNFEGPQASSMSSQHQKEKGVVGAETISKSKGGNSPTAAVGYSAVYALSVHENPNAGSAGNTAGSDASRQNPAVALSSIHSKAGQWKFLEKPLQENSSRVLALIKEESEVN